MENETAGEAMEEDLNKQQVINSIVLTRLAKGWVELALEAAKSLGTPRETIDDAILYCLGKKEFVPLQEFLKLGALEKVVDKVISTYLTGEDFERGLTKALEAAKCGASKNILKQLLLACLEEKDLESSLEVAKLLGRELTTKELENFIEVLTDKELEEFDKKASEA